MYPPQPLHAFDGNLPYFISRRSVADLPKLPPVNKFETANTKNDLDRLKIFTLLHHRKRNRRCLRFRPHVCKYGFGGSTTCSCLPQNCRLVDLQHFAVNIIVKQTKQTQDKYKHRCPTPHAVTQTANTHSE